MKTDKENSAANQVESTETANAPVIEGGDAVTQTENVEESAETEKAEEAVEASAEVVEEVADPTVDSTVNFTDNMGEKHTGVITEIKGGKFTIKAEDSVVYTVKRGDIEGISETPVVPVEEDDYTDKNGAKLVVGQPVSVKLAGAIKEGKIDGFKKIAQDEYAKVKLEGAQFAKLIPLADVEGLPYDPATLTAEKKVKEPKAPKVPKEKAEKAPKEPKEKRTTPVEGSKSAQILDLLKAGKTRQEVAKELEVKYQFVRSVDLRYNGEK